MSVGSGLNWSGAILIASDPMSDNSENVELLDWLGSNLMFVIAEVVFLVFVSLSEEVLFIFELLELLEFWVSNIKSFLEFELSFCLRFKFWLVSVSDSDSPPLVSFWLFSFYDLLVSTNFVSWPLSIGLLSCLSLSSFISLSLSLTLSMSRISFLK